MKTRASGILLHMTALPSRFGIGDLGDEARRFADFLALSGQGYWQVLPFNPTDLGRSNSPYVSDSAFAGNPLLIDPHGLVAMGLLHDAELDGPQFPEEFVDFEGVARFKKHLLAWAFSRFRERERDSLHEDFCRRNAHWLDDYALFAALKERHEGRPWNQWPDPLRYRHEDALNDAAGELREAVERERFVQYVFDRQWHELKAHCQRLGVNLLGDMPIYVHYDSADVWVHPELFKLNERREPHAVAGVPPDYFSATGQLWGNPVYNWPVLEQSGYGWWLDRCRRALDLVDFIRIDHFRGLVAYWEVPAGETTAINGEWVEAPARSFLRRLSRAFPSLPFLAEDLGVITPEVREVIRDFDLPGMKVLLFAFGDDVAKNPFAPHNHIRNCVLYTGTHDNNTVRGWFEGEADPDTLGRLFHYLGREISADEAPRVMARMAMASVADTVILPIQDVLGLGREARFNTPGTTEGNWTWRLAPWRLTSEVERNLYDTTRVYGRI